MTFDKEGIARIREAFRRNRRVLEAFGGEGARAKLNFAGIEQSLDELERNSELLATFEREVAKAKRR